MIFQYNCPECKEKLLLLENRFHCKNCLKNYEHKNNYTIFENQNFPTINHSKLLKNLFLEIKHNTFENSVNNFLKINKKFNSQFINTQYDKSIDIIFHGIGKNFLRCLDLKSELGNKSDKIVDAIGVSDLLNVYGWGKYLTLPDKKSCITKEACTDDNI